MSGRVEFFTVEEVLVIHEDQLRRYGGAAGLRDLGFLESAVRAPEFAAYYTRGGDLFRLAAIYVARLIQDHPFVDANKRTAVVAAAVFLRINGIRLSSAAKHKRRLEDLAVSVAQGREGEEAAARFLRQWARTSTKPPRQR